MRKNKNSSKIILATIAALLATVIVYSSFSGMRSQMAEQQKLLEVMQKTKADSYGDNFAYAVSTKDLKAGEMVSDEDVDFKKFDNMNTSAFENRSDVVNKVLLKDIKSGDMFTSEYIATVSAEDLTLKAGARALTLPAENFQGKSNKMVLGSTVDIFSSQEGNTWELDGIKILAFEGALAMANADINSAKAITFEVPADDIAEFISNASKNKLVLVARNANDKVFRPKKSKSSSSSSFSGAMSNSGNMGGSLPNLPSDVPIDNFPSSSLSGLPSPIKPQAMMPSVELIEANVKTKVTFD